MSKTCSKPEKQTVDAKVNPFATPVKIKGPVRLGQIKSDEGLERTLSVLQTVAKEGSDVLFNVQSETERLAQLSKTMLVEIESEDGEVKTVEFGKYLGQLVKAVEDYGFRMEKLTVENGVGRVARRSTPARVAFMAAPEDVDDPDGKTSEKAGEKLALKRVMETIGKGLGDLLKKFGLNRFWKVEVKPDITSAKAAFLRHEVTEKELAEQGMHVLPEEQRVDVSVTGSDLKKVMAYFVN